MGDPEGGPTAVLAEWAASVRPEAIPARVRQRTAQLLTDAIGCALAGRRTDETAKIEAVARAIGAGEQATAIGAGCFSRMGATFLNAYQITAITVCDVYRPNHCHVAPEVVPPALAVAEGRGATGTELVSALAVGMEVTVRIARGIDYAGFRRRGWHSPGVIGGYPRPENVERLTIGLAESTYRMHGEIGWEDRFRALLSTRYCAAVVLHDRECWLEQFEPERLADRALSGFAAERIRITVDESVPTAGAVVSAVLGHGRTVAVRRDVPKGDADDPLSADEIVGKYRRAAQGVLPLGNAERALELLRPLTSYPRSGC